MKKLFAILAVSSMMAACNNAAESKEAEKKDTLTAAPSGIAAEAQKLTDSTASKKDSTAAKTDTTTAAKH
jgi:ABC-type uncharacterized transport system auxiliary subunit